MQDAMKYQQSSKQMEKFVLTWPYLYIAINTQDLVIYVEDFETLQTNFGMWQHSFEQARLRVNVGKIEAMTHVGSRTRHKGHHRQTA